MEKLIKGINPLCGIINLPEDDNMKEGIRVTLKCCPGERPSQTYPPYCY